MSISDSPSWPVQELCSGNSPCMMEMRTSRAVQMFFLASEQNRWEKTVEEMEENMLQTSVLRDQLSLTAYGCVCVKNADDDRVRFKETVRESQ